MKSQTKSAPIPGLYQEARVQSAEGDSSAKRGPLLGVGFWQDHLAGHGVWVLLSLILLGFSLNEVYRHLLALVAIWGIVQTVRTPGEMLNTLQARYLLAMFACVWVPMVISSATSIDPADSASTTGRFLMYLFAGLTIIRAARVSRAPSTLITGIGVVVGFWVLDGLVQHAFGYDLAGFPAAGARLTGSFEGVRYGFVLALMAAPFYEAIRRWSQRWSWAWLALLPYYYVVLWGGSRTSWMLLGVGTILYGAFWLRVRERRVTIALVARGAVIVGACLLLAMQSDYLRSRIGSLTGLLSADAEVVADATAGRVPIWEVSWQMFTDNWLTGVGVRTFETAYPNYVSDPDAYQHSYPHLFIAEIGAESGILGLVGLAAFVGLIISWCVGAWRKNPAPTVPLGIAALCAAFPLSATLAFYTHFMSGLIWWATIAFLAVDVRKGVRETQQAAGRAEAS